MIFPLPRCRKQVARWQRRSSPGLSGDCEISFRILSTQDRQNGRAALGFGGDTGPLEPRFVSVTYGAGGTTRERTHNTVARIARETNIPAAAHLTCVEASKAEIASVANAYWTAGVRHIVALRGDPPNSDGKFVPHPDGYASRAELVEGLRKLHPFEISVSAYPETHPEALSAATDIDFLKRKLDAGGEPGNYAILFRARNFLPFPRRRGGRGYQCRDCPRDHARVQFCRHYSHVPI